MASSYRIVIVDDQHEVRRMLRSGVESLGKQFQVSDVPSAEEAMLLFRQPVDLLIADVKLPGISGLELFERARKRVPNLKVILITGMTDSQTRRQVANAGANAFFLKPLPMADFLDAVERILGLVETLLPPEPIDNQVDAPEKTVADILVELRQECQAQAAVLVNEKGEIVAEAGDIPASIGEENLISSFMPIFSAGAKVMACLGTANTYTLSFFSGGSYSLVYTFVGASAALLLITNRLEMLSESVTKGVTAAAEGVLRTLNRAGPLPEAQVEVVSTVSPAKKETGPLPPLEDLDVEIPEEELRSVEALFQQSTQKPSPVQDIDSFWAAVAEESGQSSGKAGALSYEEALRLGLTPEEDQAT